MATTHCSKTSYISMRANSRNYRMTPRLHRYLSSIVIPSSFLSRHYSECRYVSCCVFCCFLSGCIWWGGKVFRGELQNHASVSVLPRVCALCEGIQGKPASQTPSKWHDRNLTRYVTQKSCTWFTACCFLYLSKQRRKTSRGKGRSRCWWKSC